MFYLNEIKLRLNYLFLSFFLTASTFYLYGDLLLFLLFYKATDTISHRTQAFAYSNPAILLDSYTVAAFYFSSFLFTCQLAHQILDFLKPSLLFHEHFSLSKSLYLLLLNLLFFNLFLCFFLLPKIWTSSIAAIKTPKLLLFELTLLEYQANLELSILQANLCFFVVFFVIFSLIFLELQITFYTYKFYQIINILLIFFSAQSMYLWQNYLLMLLSFFLEFIFFLNILKHKTFKYLQILSWECIK
jgi:hypothetical protein